MTFKELLLTNISWEDIEKTWLTLYPDDILYIKNYHNMWKNLKKTEPKIYETTKFEIYIKKNIAVYYGYEVYGKKFIKNKVVQGTYGDETYALEFKSWKEWLGMNISEETERKFDPTTIICLCMSEMTMAGSTESIINKKKLDLRKRLKDGLDSIKNGTAKCISSEELFEKIKKKFEDKKK